MPGAFDVGNGFEQRTRRRAGLERALRAGLNQGEAEVPGRQSVRASLREGGGHLAQRRLMGLRPLHGAALRAGDVGAGYGVGDEERRQRGQKDKIEIGSTRHAFLKGARRRTGRSRRRPPTLDGRWPIR